MILCLGTRQASSQDTKSLTRARFLLFPSTRDGTSITSLILVTVDIYRHLASQCETRMLTYQNNEDKDWGTSRYVCHVLRMYSLPTSLHTTNGREGTERVLWIMGGGGQNLSTKTQLSLNESCVITNTQLI